MIHIITATWSQARQVAEDLCLPMGPRTWQHVHDRHQLAGYEPSTTQVIVETSAPRPAAMQALVTFAYTRRFNVSTHSLDAFRGITR